MTAQVKELDMPKQLNVPYLESANHRQLRSWRERALTIKLKADALMVDLMDAEGAPDASNIMLPSDWADNIANDAASLLESLATPTRDRGSHE